MLSDSTPLLSILVPCFNEELTVAPLVEELVKVIAKHAWQAEIVLGDDGSTDRTRAEMEKAKETCPYPLTLVCHSTNRGIAETWKSLLQQQARGQYVAVLDADLQYNPEDINALLALVRNRGSDRVIAQGVRLEKEERDHLRYLLSRSLCIALNLLFGMSSLDNKSGFFACRTEHLKEILKHRFRYHHFQHLIMVSAHAKRYEVIEYPVFFRKRNAGRSFIRNPLSFSLGALLDLPKALWEFRIRAAWKRTDPLTHAAIPGDSSLP